MAEGAGQQAWGELEDGVDVDQGPGLHHVGVEEDLGVNRTPAVTTRVKAA